MKTILLGLFISLALVPASVQHTHGSIEGVIRDLSGAPVAGASVYAYDYYMTNPTKGFYRRLRDGGSYPPAIAARSQSSRPRVVDALTLYFGTEQKLTFTLMFYRDAQDTSDCDVSKL